jgi:hypothetical protein
MDEQRKKAYRYLLYHSMLDIRPIAWMRSGFFRSLHPFNWKTSSQQIRRAGIVADWLHNLALFSVLDFERFDEGRFWQDYRHFDGRHPEFQLSAYKDLFEREVSGSGHIRA